MAKRVIHTDRLMRPIAHFSHAVRVGEVVHLGATAGVDATRRLAGESPGRVDMAAQTARMFDNAEYALGLLGATLADVVRVQAYVADPRDLPIYEAQHAARFGAGRPSLAVVGAWGFPLPQAAVELDLVAVDGGGRAVAGGMVAGDVHWCTALPPDPTGDAVAQATGALDALLDALAAAGRRPTELVNLRVTLADARDLPAFEAAWATRLAGARPSRTVVVAPLRAAGLLVQVEAIAVAGGGRPIGDAAGPAAPATLAGDTLYIGGQSAPRAAGIEAQTRAAWAGINVLLAAAGLVPGCVLRTNSVLTDWRDYAGFNAGYGANVAEPYPPRATVLGVLPSPRARVQIEAVAHRDGGDATIVQVPGGVGP